MDTRVPVPLLPMMANHQKQNMREHLVAVQAIVGAVGTKDFDAIARAAAKIGYSDQMGQMCNHMGAGAPGFTEQALRFHHTADKISEAARGRDMPRVLTALSDTLATCTGCHSVFKQQVVDESTWASLAGQSPPQHH
jgi:cytochrome c556